MAKKTNCERNGIKYFRKYATINGQRKMIYGESEKDWQSKVDELMKLDNLGIIDTKDTLGQAMETWVYTILQGKHSIKKTTFAIYEGIYRNTIKGHKLMSMSLIRVKSINVQKYINDLSESKKSPHAIQQSKKVLNMFFKYAVSEGYILKNPCTNTSTPKMPAPEEIQVFTDSEITKIKNALIGDRDRFIVLLALSTGMRQGELLALRHSNLTADSVYVDKTQISIRHIKQGEKTTYEVSDEPPKTDASYREIPLTDNVKKEYKTHAALCQIEKMKRGKGRLDNEDCVFLSKTGLRYQPAQLQKKWSQILVKAEVPYKSFHSLRHTYITKLVQSDINIVTVMQLAGHSKMETTLRYTHVEMSHKLKAIDVINELLM